MVESAWQDPVPGLSPGVLLWKQPPVPEFLEAVGMAGGLTMDFLLWTSQWDRRCSPYL